MNIENIPEYRFRQDSYDTPPGRRRALMDRLLLNSRAYFYWCNFLIFAQSGWCAKQGRLDAANQVHYSTKNIDLVESCGGRIHVRGLDNIDKLEGRPAVIIGNHMSLLETAVLHAILRGRIEFTFVIKESLLHVPLFGHIMRSHKAIPVGRTNPKEDFKQVMAGGKATLDAGCSVILFPQHTRNTEFKPDEFNTIGVKLAKHADAFVVPMALKTDFVQTGKWLRDLGPIDRSKDVWFEFGAPFKVEGNGKEEHRRIVEFIETRLAAWQSR
ncbi:MAG: lysophospholipid acyltransferase family protein [Victivallaceae bacterium]|nr:lysophospholipid acyltransferase family protein [Victivallaceae bacterium]